MSQCIQCRKVDTERGTQKLRVHSWSVITEKFRVFQEKIKDGMRTWTLIRILSKLFGREDTRISVIMTRMNSERYPYVVLREYEPDGRDDRKKDDWITFKKTVKHLVYHCQLLKDLSVTDLSGDLLCTSGLSTHCDCVVTRHRQDIKEE